MGLGDGAAAGAAEGEVSGDVWPRAFPAAHLAGAEDFCFGKFGGGDGRTCGCVRAICRGSKRS